MIFLIIFIKGCEESEYSVPYIPTKWVGDRTIFSLRISLMLAFSPCFDISVSVSLMFVDIFVSCSAAGGITALNALPAFAKGEASDGSALSAGAKEILSAFRDALENDLSTPVAVSQIQKVVKESALAPAEALSLVARMDSVLALGLLDGAKLVLSAPAAEVSSGHDGDPEAAEIDALVKERVEAKKSKNFARADEIRDELSKRGILVTDTPQGPVWSRR